MEQPVSSDDARRLAGMLGVSEADAAAGAAAMAAPAAGAGAAAVAAAAAGPQQRQGGVLIGRRELDPMRAWPQRPRQCLALPPLAAGQRFEDAYELVLLLDQRELQRAQLPLGTMVAKLEQQGVTVETRKLPVGDALWVARAR